VQVIGGLAVGPFTTLPEGHHTIKAVFTPSNPAKFKPSTSKPVTFSFGRDNGNNGNNGNNDN
jgi:hypothetical protein